MPTNTFVHIDYNKWNIIFDVPLLVFRLAVTQNENSAHRSSQKLIYNWYSTSPTNQMFHTAIYYNTVYTYVPVYIHTLYYKHILQVVVTCSDLVTWPYWLVVSHCRARSGMESGEIINDLNLLMDNVCLCLFRQRLYSTYID